MRRSRETLGWRRAIASPLAALAAVASAFALSAASAAAGPGDPDPSFGVRGQVLAPFGYAAHDVLLLPGGRFVVVGSRLCPGGACGLTLARFHGSGEPDDAFGSHGGVFTPMPGVIASAVARQADGKLVVAGGRAAQDEWVVARYDEDGTLDPGFGSGGVAVIDRTSAFAADIAVTAAGKLVVAGTLDGTFAIARYNPDGSLDAGFGDGGTAVTPVGSGGSLAQALLELPDGKFLAAGDAMGPGLFGDTSHHVLLRYNADGSLDQSFGAQGKSMGPAGGANALVRQPDGRIVTAGSGLARYNDDGSIDPQFPAEVSVDVTFFHDVVLQPDGKLVLVGVWRTLKATSWVVRRLEPDGAQDASFCLPPAPPAGEAFAAALRPDGTLLVAGEGPEFGSGYMLRRYVGDSSGRCADLLAPIPQLRIPRQGLGRVLTNGLTVRVESTEPGKATLRLVPARKTAERFGLRRGTTLGRASHRFARAGRKRVQIKLSRAAGIRMNRARSATFHVRLALADRSGNTARVARRLTLRR